MIVDFKKIKDALKKYDHADLNCACAIPTAENLVRLFLSVIWALGMFDRVTIKIAETPNNIIEGTVTKE
jgi:6-pyruvoyl-tetrahydropterin synthase